MKFDFNVDRSLVIDGVYAKYHFSDASKPLVVTFANLGALIRPKEIKDDLSPWGFDFVKKQQLNILSFASLSPSCWYRTDSLLRFITSISKELQIFPERLGYGGSMGGFGISAFANLLNIDRALLLNPISTLNNDLAPWETRFVRGRTLEWKFGIIDGATMQCPGHIVYDPLCKLDRLHALRYNKNIVHLKIPGVGHSIPTHLHSMKLLKPLFQSFVANKIDRLGFHSDVRKRRTIAAYYKGLLNDESRKLSEIRRNIILRKRDEQFPKKGTTLQNISVERQAADLLRDSAILIENVDLKKSLRLMELAYKIRSGAFINSKIAEYEKRLKVT